MDQGLGLSQSRDKKPYIHRGVEHLLGYTHRPLRSSFTTLTRALTAKKIGHLHGRGSPSTAWVSLSPRPGPGCNVAWPGRGGGQLLGIFVCVHFP